MRFPSVAIDVRFARLTASSSTAAASRTCPSVVVAPRAQLLAEHLEEVPSILLRRAGAAKQLGGGTPAEGLQVEPQPIPGRLEPRPPLLEQPDLLRERDRRLGQLGSEGLVCQRLEPGAIARTVERVDPGHQRGVADLLLLGPGEVGVEAAGEAPVERLEIRRGRRLRYGFVVGFRFPRVAVELLRALALHPSRPRRALLRRDLGQQLGPSLELPDHRGDPLEASLLLGELCAVPGLERGQRDPQRLGLELELGHLVAELLERGEEKSQLLAQRRRREDDGGGTEAGHGGDAESTGLPAPLRPTGGPEASPLSGPSARPEPSCPCPRPSAGPGGRARGRPRCGALPERRPARTGPRVRAGGGPGAISAREGGTGWRTGPSPRCPPITSGLSMGCTSGCPPDVSAKFCRGDTGPPGEGADAGEPGVGIGRATTPVCPFHPGAWPGAETDGPTPCCPRSNVAGAGAHRRRRRDDDRVDRRGVTRHHRGLGRHRSALAGHAGRGDDLHHPAPGHRTDHHARSDDGRGAEHHRGRRADGRGDDDPGLRAGGRRHEDAVGPHRTGVAHVHHADLDQRDVHRRRRWDEDAVARPPEPGDEDHRVTAVLVIGLGVDVAGGGRARPVAAGPDPFTIPPGPVTADPDRLDVRRGGRRVPAHRRRRPGNGHGHGLLERRLDLQRHLDLRLHDRCRRWRRRAIRHRRRRRWSVLVNHAPRGEQRASDPEHPAHRSPSFLACGRDAQRGLAIQLGYFPWPPGFAATVSPWQWRTTVEAVRRCSSPTGSSTRAGCGTRRWRRCAGDFVASPTTTAARARARRRSPVWTWTPSPSMPRRSSSRSDSARCTSSVSRWAGSWACGWPHGGRSSFARWRCSTPRQGRSLRRQRPVTGDWSGWSGGSARGRSSAG